jgi:hypothetical protein
VSKAITRNQMKGEEQNEEECHNSAKEKFFSKNCLQILKQNSPPMAGGEKKKRKVSKESATTCVEYISPVRVFPFSDIFRVCIEQY